MKSFIKALVRRLPFKADLVNALAMLPPVLKIRGLIRVCNLLLEGSTSKEKICTNLGINSRLRVELPIDAGRNLLVGTPMHYEGERGPLYLAKCLAPTCEVFLDIGANFGYFTYFLRASGVETPIHYFEPTPHLFDLIKHNIDKNLLRDITGHQLAVGEVNGQAVFHLNLSDPSSSSLDSYFTTKHRTVKINVEVVSFDSFVLQNKLRNICAKVDIESAEDLFVRGAEKRLGDLKILIIEILGPAIQNGIVKRLIDYGFHAYYINDFDLEYSIDGRFNYVPPQYNWLFCRLAPAELQSLLIESRFRIRG